jgi:very-short-patch-repair endonuclease
VTGTKLYDPPRNGEGDRSAKPSGGGGPRILHAPIKQVKRARQLRRQMSLPEILLWQALRRRANGLKFRRQFPTDRITTDFACLSHRLIIEVDGEGHSFGDQPRRDGARDALLRRDGFYVLRVAARDVLKDLDAVLRFIPTICAEVGPLHHDAARRGPPPRPGEELR